MQIGLEQIQNTSFETLKRPENGILVSDRERYTPEYLRAQFPDASRIFVLDFPVLFEGNCEPLIGPNGEMLGLRNKTAEPEIINIDHHSQHTDFNRTISTTHQALIANQSFELRPDPEDVVIVNHTDTDSVLSLLALTNPEISWKVKMIFAHAAVAADHTGEFSPLISLIDAMYHDRDLDKSINTLLQFLTEGDINLLNLDVIENYYVEIVKRKKALEIVKERKFREIGNGVILIELDGPKSMQSIPFPALFDEFGIYATVIIISNPLNGKYKLNVRAGRNFPENSSLQDIDTVKGLSRFGYGGRARAGGNDRFLETADFITPEAFALLVSSYFD